MKKSKPEKKNIFHAVAGRLSRFFGKDAAGAADAKSAPADSADAKSAPAAPSGPKSAPASSPEPESASGPRKVRRRWVKASRPKLRAADKATSAVKATGAGMGPAARKAKTEEVVPISHLSSDRVGAAIRDYALAHLSDSNLNVETMAEQLKVGRTSLYKLVRREFDVTPAEFILDLRLQKAEALLTQGQKVFEVAELCGFTDPKYFSKVFKRYYGMLPRAWQAQQKRSK